MDNSFSSLPEAERQRILGKLSKLKALSECKTGNVNETAAAAAAMTRLMPEYQIEMAELEVGPSHPEEVVAEDLDDEVRGKGFPQWQTSLLSCLAEAHGCIGYSAYSTHQHFFGSFKSVRLRLLGRPQDIGLARSLFFYCLSEIERLCYLWSPRAGVARKNDFRQGAARAVADRVESERSKVVREEQERARQRGQASRALAVLDRRQEEVRQAGQRIGLHSRPQYARPVAVSAYSAGYSAGSALNLERAVRPALA